MNSKRDEDKIQVLARLANTNDGMIILKYAREDYLVKCPVDKDNPYMTYYNLGMQKLVRKALSLVEDSLRFDRVKIINKMYKE